MTAEQFRGDAHEFAGAPRTESAFVQSASALLRHGPEYAGVLLQGLFNWLNHKGYQTLDEVRGLLAAPDAEDSAARERADYVSALRKANSGSYDTY